MRAVALWSCVTKSSSLGDIPSFSRKIPLGTQITIGHLISLATADVERFQWSGTFCQYLWLAPLETLVVLYFGMKTVGVSFLAGFVALALLVPTQVSCHCSFSRELNNGAEGYRKLRHMLVHGSVARE